MAKKVREYELAPKTDETDGTVIYEGFPDEYSSNGVPANLPTSAAKWGIRRQTKVDTVWTTAWADGDQKKDNVWDDRATLNYVVIPLFSNYQG